MTNDSNISKWLIEAETKNGEMIEAIVVGRHDNEKWDGDAKADEDIILSREDGLKKLDVNYDSGYGGADCFPMLAWSRNRIYFISEYDGATSLNSVPRHPVACTPEFA